MTRDRNVLAQIIKAWAQEHDTNYQINDPAPGDQGVSNTATYLSWAVKEHDHVIDLVGLLDRLELFIERKRTYRGPDGMFCRKCQLFYQFAEPNQEDGTLLCYSCRQCPY